MTEDQLQSICFIWFWNHYPNLRKTLFSVPNGGLRNQREAQKMKSTGTVAGVADLLFIHKSKVYAIEMKTLTGIQQKNQKEWQRIIENQGVDYFICRSLEEFKEIIKKIL